MSTQPTACTTRREVPQRPPFAFRRLALCALAAAFPLIGPLAQTTTPSEVIPAVAQDDPQALLELGRRYHQGQGVPKDLARAAGLYERAAQLGNPDAQYALGNLYLLGEGVPQDDDWAFTWYRAAARQGHALAQKNVSEFYRAAGVSPPADEQGATSGPLPPPPAGAPAQSSADDDVVPSSLPTAPVPVPDEVSPDEMKALELARSRGILVEGELPHALQPTVPEASNPPPTEASAAPADPNLEAARQQLQAGKPLAALPTLEQQAGAGNPEAQWLLSEVLSSLKRTPYDQTNAWLWLQRAAAGGWRDAQYALAQRYDRGEGVSADEAEAVTWYRAAARQGHPAALERLRAIYRDAGLPVPTLDASPPATAPPAADPSASGHGSYLPCRPSDCLPRAG